MHDTLGSLDELFLITTVKHLYRRAIKHKKIKIPDKLQLYTMSSTQRNERSKMLL